MKKLLNRYSGRYLDAGIRAEPKLWHNPVGAYLAFHKFGVKDPGVLRAIARHSIGGPGMHPLDKLIYVADYCEELRTHAAAERVRVLAFKDLDAAVSAVARAKLNYLKRRGLAAHPDSLALAREYGISRLYVNSRF
jgi:predicted HD superfamily hydrolase involved in NAD metabolism